MVDSKILDEIAKRAPAIKERVAPTKKVPAAKKRVAPEPKPEPPKRKPACLYISRENESYEFAIMGVRGRRDKGHPGKVVWRFPLEKEEAIKKNHFVVTGRIVPWLP